VGCIIGAVFQHEGEAINHMATPKLTPEIINAAIDGFEAQKTHIDSQIQALRQMLEGGPAETTATREAPTRKRKKFSAAARRKMALAQKARWAKIKGESEPPAPAATHAPTKAKRILSKAGRAAIVAATKKRWALKRAADAAKAKQSAVKRVAKKATGRKTATPSTPAVAQAGGQ
jgi:hypothetical protein